MTQSFSTTIGYLLLVYAIFTILFYFAADFLMYFPPKPSLFKDSASTLKLTLEDKTTISAVYKPNPKAKYTILFSHGNAEDLGTLEPFLAYYQSQGFSIISYDYPGYGTSTGKPNENSTYQAIFAVYHYLRNQKKIPAADIIVHGRSLGCGPSVELASVYPVGGLILESPFVSAYRVETRIPLFPFDRYKNLKKLHSINVPTLIIHGVKDNIIAPWHSRMIFNALKGYKQAFWVEGAGHNNVLYYAGPGYWQAIETFLRDKP